MLTVLVVIGVLFAVIMLVRFIGGEKMTIRTMGASYYGYREMMGPSTTEVEVLARTLKSRPPFDTYTDDMIREIIELCPDIEALTAFVIGFDRQSQVK